MQIVVSAELRGIFVSFFFSSLGVDKKNPWLLFASMGALAAIPVQCLQNVSV